MQLRLKRVYDPAAPDDGFRVLVDRLWPRGLTRERAMIDMWAKDAAPSTALRRAYHQSGLPWDEFAASYRAELAANPAVDQLRAELEGRAAVTLLYGAHDSERNHAVILLGALEA